jgi:asparagine synthase (glutamine-hydrolysing)
MSGIVGIIHFDGRPVNGEQLRRMTQAIAHRGPDGEAHWQGGAMGLGHRMMHTTPEARAESQPLNDESGQLCLTFDGRIDNRAELQAAINRAGWPLRTNTDAELVLRAYQCWGEESPQRLLGDFAYGLWDAQRRTLFCARDQFGVKPFYYHLTDRLFIFASEVKAILALPEVSARLNEPRIADYLTEYLEGYDRVSSFYEGIYKLPPAHTAVIRNNQIKLTRYWALDPHREIQYKSDAEYEEAFRELFTDAVRCRLRSAGPVGSMLSGGMDSSSIVCVARELLLSVGKTPLHTFSAIADGDAHCQVETQAIFEVLRGGGFNAHTITPEELPRFVTKLDKWVRQVDDLFDTQIAHVPLTMYLLAQEQGVNVVLDGVDGDVLASLNCAPLRYQLRAGRWRDALSCGKELADFFETPLWSMVGREACATAAYLALPRALLRGMRRRVRRGPKWAHNNSLNRGFAQRVQLPGRFVSTVAQEDTFLASSIKEEKAHELSQAYVTAALERYERVAAAHGVEARHPLFDRRLVEFCLAIPWQQHFLNGWTKPLMRRAMKGIIPDAIRWRKNWEHVGQAFSAAWRKLWVAPIARGTLYNLDLVAQFVDVPRVQQAHQRYLSAHASVASQSDAHLLWLVTVLLTWLQGQTMKGQLRS